MTKRKKRLEKSRTPNKFSVHLTTDNLKKIEQIEKDIGSNSRNEAINAVISDYDAYLAVSDIVKAFQRFFFRTENFNNR